MSVTVMLIAPTVSMNNLLVYVLLLLQSNLLGGSNQQAAIDERHNDVTLAVPKARNEPI
jgi:hypothetical protein